MFEDALEALGELLDGAPDGEHAVRDLDLAAPDRSALLADWLAELAYLAEAEGLIPMQAEQLELGDGRVRARVAARFGRPPHLVKAVTYHRLEFERRDDAWHARVVLDV